MDNFDKMKAEIEAAKRGELAVTDNSFSSFDFDRQTGVPIPEGIHTFEITEVKEKSGEQTPSGFTYVNLTLECIGNKQFEGQRTYHGFSLSPQSRFVLDRLLEAVGAPESGKATTQYFVGKKLKARIQHTTYEDKEGVERTKAEVKEVYPVNFQPKEKVNPNEALKKMAKPKTRLPDDVSVTE